MRLSFLLFSTAAVIGSATDQLQCDFECFNGSVCAAGAADYSDHPTNANGEALDFHVEVERNGKHCACLPGFTGLFCKRMYEDCNSGDHKCYHGGQCIPGLNDIYGNEQLFCDCTGAIDEHGVQYVGKYCEIPKTGLCDAEGNSFCVNGGWCKDDYENQPSSPCNCGDNAEGPHCEFDRGAVPECTLDCQNGGECMLGIKQIVPGHEDFLFEFWNRHSDYQYCECPPGFQGTQCQIKSERCGEHHCFHGGECVTLTDGTHHFHHCDCRRARTASATFGGRYCQYETTTLCDQEKTANGQLFCLNGGTCNENGSFLNCTCPEGWHGPICEFKDEQRDQIVQTSQITNQTGQSETLSSATSPPVDNYEDCNLICENGGQCRNGIKDTSWLDQFGPELALVNVTNDENFEHCVCPDGFLGLRCETPVETCPGGEHICLHFSKCVPDGQDWECDCPNGVAGKFCEQKSTAICTEGGSVASGSFVFCVNNGVCVDLVEDNEEHPGCECPEAYYGPHCEWLKQDAHQGEHVVFDDEGNRQEDNNLDDADQSDPAASPPLVKSSNPQSSANANSSGTLGTSALVGIAVAGCILVTGSVLFLRRRHRVRMARQVEASLRHAETTPVISVPTVKRSVRRYRDVLADPDIPDMGEGSHPRRMGSYHDRVFENVDIL